MKRKVVLSVFLVVGLSALGAYGLNAISSGVHTTVEANDPTVETNNTNDIDDKVDQGFSFSEVEFNEILAGHSEDMNFTKDEVHNWINVLHNSIDINLIFLKQNDFNVDSKEYKETKDNLIRSKAVIVSELSSGDYFEQEFHENIINDIYNYFKEYAMGNEEKLFSLKNALFELDLEINPNLYKQVRATYISLSDSERIRNGIKPSEIYYE